MRITAKEQALVSKARLVLSAMEKYAGMEKPPLTAWVLMQKLDCLIDSMLDMNKKLPRATIHYDIKVWGYDHQVIFPDFYKKLEALYA